LSLVNAGTAPLVLAFEVESPVFLEVFPSDELHPSPFAPGTTAAWRHAARRWMTWQKTAAACAGDGAKLPLLRPGGF
jgi:hypothetical protein